MVTAGLSPFIHRYKCTACIYIYNINYLNDGNSSKIEQMEIYKQSYIPKVKN